MLKKYGRTGAFTYLGLSSMVTTGEGRRCALWRVGGGWGSFAGEEKQLVVSSKLYAVVSSGGALINEQQHHCAAAGCGTPRSPSLSIHLHTTTTTKGFYIAIKNNVDVKKLVGIKGASLARSQREASPPTPPFAHPHCRFCLPRFACPRVFRPASFTTPHPLLIPPKNKLIPKSRGRPR